MAESTPIRIQLLVVSALVRFAFFRCGILIILSCPRIQLGADATLLNTPSTQLQVFSVVACVFSAHRFAAPARQIVERMNHEHMHAHRVPELVY
jgi:hypothetical protein